MPCMLWQNQQKTVGTISRSEGKDTEDEAGMMMEQSLLDLLSIQIKCEYSFYLRFLYSERRRDLAQILECLTPLERAVRS